MGKRWNNSKAFLEAKAQSPYYATILTVLVMFTGVWGSLCAPEIRQAFPFVLGPYREVSWEAAIFWILVVVTALVFFARQQSVDVNLKTQSDRLIEKNEKLEQLIANVKAQSDRLIEKNDILEQLIRTLPPEDFLDLCAELNHQCNQVYEGVVERGANLSKEELDHSARLVLRALVILAQKFDRNDDALYAANIMLFRGAEEIPDEEVPGWNDRLFFTGPDTSIRRLSGLLVLIPELSTTSAGEPTPDIDVTPIVLPVPKQAESNLVFPGENVPRSWALPGAPRAFLRRRMEFYLDTSMLAQWCKLRGDFSPGIQDQIAAYFQGPGSDVRSFASLPLLLPGGTGAAFGVVNFHSDQHGLLRDERLAQQFSALIRPMLANLQRLAAMRAGR